MRDCEILIHQREHRIEDNAYKFVQCDFAYNSNHIEGSTLTHDQTVSIFERGTVTGTIRLDDAIEAKNHFNLLDHVLDTCDEPLTPDYLCRLHAILKRGTRDEDDPLQAVGRFKLLENEIRGAVSTVRTASPAEVPALVEGLFLEYEAGALDYDDPLETMAELHWRLENIHPFSDGNGRVGRAVLFKECLRRDVTPLIITEDLRDFYLRGLRMYPKEHGWLVDTLGTAQDRFCSGYVPLMREYERLVAELCGPGDSRAR